MRRWLAFIGVVIALGSGPVSGQAGLPEAAESTSPRPEDFVRQAEEQLLALWTEAARASWIQSTYITGDTQILAALASKRAIEAAAKLAKDSAGFETADLPRELARKLELLRLSLTLAVPPDPKASEELTRLVTAMESRYGKGKVCGQAGDECQSLQELSRTMATSRDPKS